MPTLPTLDVPDSVWPRLLETFDNSAEVYLMWLADTIRQYVITKEETEFLDQQEQAKKEFFALQKQQREEFAAAIRAELGMEPIP